MQSAPPRILFLNTGVRHNLGDRAMLLNVVRLVRAHLPDAELIVDAGTPAWMVDEFRLQPASTMAHCWSRSGVGFATLYGILAIVGMSLLLRSGAYRCLPRRSMEGEFLRSLAGADLIWMVGGGYLNDLGRREARAVLTTAYFGRMQNIPLVMTGQGLGPFFSRYSRWLLRRALGAARSISLRESIAGPREFDLPAFEAVNWHCGVDDAASLPWLPGECEAELAINFRQSLFHGQADGFELRVFRVIREVLAEGKRVRLFVFSERPQHELAIYQQWIERLSHHPMLELVCDPDPRKLLAALSGCKRAIGMAYHFHLFAALAGVPVVSAYTGRYYASKFAGIDHVFGLPKSHFEYAELDDDRLDTFLKYGTAQSGNPCRAEKERVGRVISGADRQILDALEIGITAHERGKLCVPRQTGAGGKGKRAAWYVADPNPRKAGLRYRCLYPFEFLRQNGFEVSLFRSDERYDCVAFDAWELFSPDPQRVERMLDTWREMGRRGVRRVLDNCDNQFAGEHTEAWRAGCGLLRTLAAEAEQVVTCSERLAAVMQAECELKTPPQVIVDPVERHIRYPGDTSLRSWLSPGRKLSWARYLRLRFWLKHDRTPLVWFGFHGVGVSESGMASLAALRAILEGIDRDHPISLTVISNNQSKFAQIFANWNIPVAYMEWDRVTFLAAMRRHKICLLPTHIDPYAATKSANRVVTALANGLNVVCDAVPSYQAFSGAVQIGNWESGIRRYLEDFRAAKQDLATGQAIIAEQYSLPIVSERWRSVMLG